MQSRSPKSGSSQNRGFSPDHAPNIDWNRTRLFICFQRYYRSDSYIKRLSRIFFHVMMQLPTYRLILKQSLSRDHKQRGHIMFERKLFRSDMLRCALCFDAPCAKACVKTDPSKLLRSIWFDNEKGAALSLPEINPCTDCAASCEAACIRSGEVPIRSTIMRLYADVRPNLEVRAPETEERLRTEVWKAGLTHWNLYFSELAAFRSRRRSCSTATESLTT